MSSGPDGGYRESGRLDSNQRPPASKAGALPTAPLPGAIPSAIEERVRGFEPLPPAWKAVVLAVEHHTRKAPLEAGNTPGWIRTNDLPRIRRTLYRPSYGRNDECRCTGTIRGCGTVDADEERRGLDSNQRLRGFHPRALPL